MENALGNIVLTLVILVPLIFSAIQARRKRNKTTGHNDRPAAAPATAGHTDHSHGDHGHDGHGHSESHGHDDHGHGHGGNAMLQWSLGILGIVVILGSAALFLKALSGPPASVVRHSPAQAGSMKLTDRPVQPASPPCSRLPGEPQTAVIPVEGSYGPLSIPQGYRICFERTGKLRAKWSDTAVEPSEWGGTTGSMVWVGIIPGESSEPLTLKYWVEPY